MTMLSEMKSNFRWIFPDEEKGGKGHFTLQLRLFNLFSSPSRLLSIREKYNNFHQDFTSLQFSTFLRASLLIFLTPSVEALMLTHNNRDHWDWVESLNILWLCASSIFDEIHRWMEKLRAICESIELSGDKLSDYTSYQ